jgi:hypothetical protein
MLGLSLEVSSSYGIIVIRMLYHSPAPGCADDRRDFSRYDEQKEMIESVGLVKAKRGKLSLPQRYEAKLQTYLSTISPMSWSSVPEPPLLSSESRDRIISSISSRPSFHVNCQRE